MSCMTADFANSAVSMQRVFFQRAKLFFSFSEIIYQNASKRVPLLMFPIAGKY